MFNFGRNLIPFNREGAKFHFNPRRFAYFGYIHVFKANLVAEPLNKPITYGAGCPTPSVAHTAGTCRWSAKNANSEHQQQPDGRASDAKAKPLTLLISRFTTVRSAFAFSSAPKYADIFDDTSS